MRKPRFTGEALLKTEQTFTLPNSPPISYSNCDASPTWERCKVQEARMLCRKDPKARTGTYCTLKSGWHGLQEMRQTSLIMRGQGPRYLNLAASIPAVSLSSSEKLASGPCCGPCVDERSSLSFAAARTYCLLNCCPSIVKRLGARRSSSLTGIRVLAFSDCKSRHHFA